MAPVSPLPLLVFLSLVSSSGSFLMKRSHSAPLPPRPSPVGHDDDAESFPFQTRQGLQSQTKPAALLNTSNEQTHLEVRDTVPIVDEDVLKTLLWTTFNNSAGSVGKSDAALNYITDEARYFAKKWAGGVTDNNVLENLSWNSRNPSPRTEQRRFRYADVDSIRPQVVSLDTDLHSRKRHKSSFKDVSGHLDIPVVVNRDLHDGTTEDSKLWTFVRNLRDALQTLSADDPKPWLKMDKGFDDTGREMMTESAGKEYDLVDPDTIFDQDILDEGIQPSGDMEQVWLGSGYTSLPSSPHQTLEQTNPITPMLPNTPVSKRFSVPLHKNVFVYGHDDRLRVFLPQMRKFPFSNIARLSTGCTGTLVTPRHVLTAAHCVHNGLVFRNNLEKLKIEIPDTMGFKDYYAQKITIPTGWLRENRSGRGRQSGRRAVYDYAVVRLKLAVTGRTKFLALAVPRPEVLQMDFHFLAFPQDDQQLWRSVCLASQHMALGDGNLILTRCDAAVGNSGAAVFIQDPHGGLKVVGILSNTMHVGHHRSFFRYSIITALTWPKLTDICNELGALGRKYNVCPPVRFMRRTSYPPRIKVIPFFGKRSPPPSRGPVRSSAETLWL